MQKCLECGYETNLLVNDNFCSLMCVSKNSENICQKCKEVFLLSVHGYCSVMCLMLDDQKLDENYIDNILYIMDKDLELYRNIMKKHLLDVCNINQYKMPERPKEISLKDICKMAAAYKEIAESLLKSEKNKNESEEEING